MANSFVTNLYPKPTNGTTMERLQVTATTGNTGNSFQTTYNKNTKYIVLDVQGGDALVNYNGDPTDALGHRLYAGRSYTWSKVAAEKAKFIKATSATANIHATEFTD